MVGGVGREYSLLCCPSTYRIIENEGSQPGVCTPHIPHSKNTHFEHKEIFHDSMTTHAMLHGDCNNMQHEVLNHL
jgi:hypothetical protein